MLHNRLLQDKEMTVKHDCDKSSCRTFLSHRVFIIIYIFKSNVWRLYDIQVRREKALGDDSYSTRSTLMTHTDRSSCAALSQTHLSGLQRKHHVGTLLCCQVRSLPRVVFSFSVSVSALNPSWLYRKLDVQCCPVHSAQLWMRMWILTGVSSAIYMRF